MALMLVWIGSIGLYVVLNRAYLCHRGLKERALFAVLFLVPTIGYYPFLPGPLQILPLGVSMPSVLGAGTFAIALNLFLLIVAWGVIYALLALITDKTLKPHGPD